MLLFFFLESSFNISPDYLRLKVSACEQVRPQHLNMSIIKELSTIVLVLKTPKISTIFKMIIKGIEINKYKWDIKCKRKSVKITIMYAKQFCLTTLASNKCTMFAGNKFFIKITNKYIYKIFIFWYEFFCSLALYVIILQLSFSELK